jgi:hypothetical protein
MKQFIGLKITNLILGEYHIVTIRLNDNSEYTANISSFNNIYCYPTISEWPKGYIGEFRADVEWPTGFGIHLDQIAGLSIKQSITA